jgi:hypothetical protein
MAKGGELSLANKIRLREINEQIKEEQKTIDEFDEDDVQREYDRFGNPSPLSFNQQVVIAAENNLEKLQEERKILLESKNMPKGLQVTLGDYEFDEHGWAYSYGKFKAKNRSFGFMVSVDPNEKASVSWDEPYMQNATWDKKIIDEVTKDMPISNKMAKGGETKSEDSQKKSVGGFIAGAIAGSLGTYLYQKNKNKSTTSERNKSDWREDLKSDIDKEGFDYAMTQLVDEDEINDEFKKLRNNYLSALKKVKNLDGLKKEDKDELESYYDSEGIDDTLVEKGVWRGIKNTKFQSNRKEYIKSRDAIKKYLGLDKNYAKGGVLSDVDMYVKIHGHYPEEVMALRGDGMGLGIVKNEAHKFELSSEDSRKAEEMGYEFDYYDAKGWVEKEEDDDFAKGGELEKGDIYRAVGNKWGVFLRKPSKKIQSLLSVNSKTTKRELKELLPTILDVSDPLYDYVKPDSVSGDFGIDPFEYHLILSKSLTEMGILKSQDEIDEEQWDRKYKSGELSYSWHNDFQGISYKKKDNERYLLGTPLFRPNGKQIKNPTINDVIEIAKVTKDGKFVYLNPKYEGKKWVKNFLQKLKETGRLEYGGEMAKGGETKFVNLKTLKGQSEVEKYLQKGWSVKYQGDKFAILQKGGKKMVKGGATFDDKVKAISKNLKGRKVPKKLQKDYGKTYDTKQERDDAARRIAGAMRAEEMGTRKK